MWENEKRSFQAIVVILCRPRFKKDVKDEIFQLPNAQNAIWDRSCNRIEFKIFYPNTACSCCYEKIITAQNLLCLWSKIIRKASSAHHKSFFVLKSRLHKLKKETKSKSVHRIFVGILWFYWRPLDFFVWWILMKNCSTLQAYLITRSFSFFRRMSILVFVDSFLSSRNQFRVEKPCVRFNESPFLFIKVIFVF